MGTEKEQTPVPRNRLADSHGPAWLVQAAVIARQFFIDGRSKKEIADDLGLSRFQVARILDEARDLGLVEVTVRLPALIDAEASTDLRRHLGITRTIVVRHDDPYEPVRSSIGRIGADLLTELVTAEDTLGLSCSRSVFTATEMLGRLPACRVVQLTGTLASGMPGGGSVESVRNAVAAGAGEAFAVYAPMLVPDEATARSLMSKPAIAEAFAQIGSVTTAMVAFGGWGPGASTIWDELSAEDRELATTLGAVGEVGGRIFDDRGRQLESNVDGRVIGMTLEQLRRIDHVVGLAHHADRAAAVRAAARGGLLDTLVCDDALARALLALPDASPSTTKTAS